jgi:tetratricopeptide (TPR) repeat protein
MNRGLQESRDAPNLASDSTAMKTIFHAILICLFPVAMLQAQEAEKPKQELPAFQQEFLNLPKEKRDEFIKKYGEAQRLFGQKRVFEALAQLDEAAKIFANSPDLLNLTGACQVEFRNFDEAMKAFHKADEVFPNQFQIRFNIAELHFVAQRWEEAHTQFSGLLAMVGTTSAEIQTARLIEFKILICKLKLGKKDEVVAMSKKYDYLDDSPFPYFAKALLLFTEKNENEAQIEMVRAMRIFQDPNIIAPWRDTMTEVGYIKGDIMMEEGSGAAGE